MDSICNKKETLERRRQLRHNSTDAERVIWSIVRNRQLLGLKFFRQYSVGNYILDFFCPEVRLAIEADGGQHNAVNNRVHDLERTQYLQQQNIHVLRFWNNDILKNIAGIYNAICIEVERIKRP